MKITSVQITNFMGIGLAEFSLEDKGLVLLQGENHDDPSADSNGAGKSSLADAISWCLTGETARDGLSADAVVNRIAKKNCEVSIDLQDANGDLFQVSRWRKKDGAAKKNGCSIFVIPAGASSTTELTKGTDALTQEAINQALGCSPEVFKAAVYAGQEKLPNLPAMTDKPLKELIEEASGVTTLIKASEIARDKLKAAERQLDSWRLDHIHLENEVTSLTSRIKDLTTRRDSWSTLRDAATAQLKLELTQSTQRAREHQKKRDEVDPVRIQAEIDKLDEKIDAVHAENDEEQRLLNEEREVAARRITMETHYKRAVDDAQQHKHAFVTIKDRVGSPCSTCGKPYQEHDLASASEIAKDKLTRSVAGAREISADVLDLRTREKTASDALQAFRSGKTDIRATVEERKRFAGLLLQRTTAENSLTNEVATATRLKRDLDAKLAEENPFVEITAGCEKELKEALQAHRESEVQGAELERQVMVRKDVVKVFGPAGVRAHILDTVTPLLNAKTAEYLGTLSDGRITAIWSTLVIDPKGELKEKFAITVSKDGAGGSFSELSGGEKRKVRLACALALQDLVASRAHKPLSLFIADEIDDALDDAGLERLMTVLESKARERGTVLVISHNSLTDWIRDTATMTMKGGQSTLSGALELI